MNKKLRYLVYPFILFHLSIHVYEFHRISYINLPDHSSTYNLDMSKKVLEFLTKNGIIKYFLFLLIAIIIDIDFSFFTKKPINDSTFKTDKPRFQGVHQIGQFIEHTKAFICTCIYFYASEIVCLSYLELLVSSFCYFLASYMLYYYLGYLKIVVFMADFIRRIYQSWEQIFNVGTKIKNTLLPLEIREFFADNGFSLSVRRVDSVLGYNIGVFRSNKKVLIQVLNKTLEFFTEKELISILYHEIGHVMHNDNFNNLITAISFQVLFWFIEFFMVKYSKKLKKGGSKANNLVMLLLLLSITFYPLIGCVINYFLYNSEINADKFSISHAPKKYLISGLKKLDSANYAPYDSSWLFNILYLDHPTLKRRLEIIKNM